MSFFKSARCKHNNRDNAGIKQTRTVGLCLGAAMILASCASPQVETGGISVEAVAPRIGGNTAILQSITAQERAHLQLIATNFVATLVQIPAMQSGSATLQINNPATAFGNAVVRALEEAGFGLQRVSADQGQNYVSYSKRLSETESGLVTDYTLAVGRVVLSREFSVEAGAIYPSSLMNIDGVRSTDNIALADEIFSEQGGDGNAFISGIQLAGSAGPDLIVRTVDVNSFDAVPLEKRSTQESVFEKARLRHRAQNAKRSLPDLQLFDKYRRTVLIFDNNSTQVMGRSNKLAVRLMIREFSDDDILVIKACQDADGSNDASLNRAIRVEQELAGFGVPNSSSYIAPCSRSGYRHTSDDSPSPVELIHYRAKKS